MKATANREPKGIRAWLVRWDWMGDHAAVEQPILAVLNWRLGVDRIRWLVEALYATKSYEPSEMLQWCRRPEENPYKARLGTAPFNDGEAIVQVPWTGEVICGHNPWIVARQVAKLRVVRRPGPLPGMFEDEGLAWEDLPRPQARL
jgi:hypothetical protein